MSLQNRTLYFLVENFSNNQREAFFEKELTYLSKTFDFVYVVPLYPDETKLDFEASNVKVLNFNYFSATNRLKNLVLNFSTVFKIYCYEFRKTHNKLFYILQFGSNVNSLLTRIGTAKSFDDFIGERNYHQTVFYSYWFSHWPLVLSILKITEPNLKFASRAHGADLYEEQTNRTLPFRYFQYLKVNMVLPVSESGANYLVTKFLVPTKKISVARLGLQIKSPLSPVNPGELHIVSCSSLIPLKRVHLIIDVLKQIKTPCRWTHFGSGLLMEELLKQAGELPRTCNYEFKGHVPNEKFTEYMAKNSVSFLINVSESEGIPVSMMEAIAFGVPIMGTNVGGVSEIITEITGFILDKDFDVVKTAHLIDTVHCIGKIYEQDYRTRVQNFYYQNYYAKNNYTALSETLIKL